MAKKSIIARAAKKRAAVEKYAARRAALVAVTKDASASADYLDLPATSTAPPSP